MVALSEFPRTFSQRHLLGIEGLAPWEIQHLLDRADAYVAHGRQADKKLGLMRGLTLGRRPRAPIPLAVDEWNVWYRATGGPTQPKDRPLEETYDLQDALVVAMHLNAFVRHAVTVRMANIAQLVNVIAPVVTRPDGASTRADATEKFPVGPVTTLPLTRNVPGGRTITGAGSA